MDQRPREAQALARQAQGRGEGRGTQEGRLTVSATQSTDGAGRGPGLAAPGHFPGGTAVSRVRIYDWPAPDGLRGGSPHIHLVCTEGYVVTGGAGRLQTLGPDGDVEVPLQVGDVVWFTPGVIHRAVNDDGLEILVVMQNAGLPEAGDAVMTMPPEILADPKRYAAEIALSTPDRLEPADEPVARRRRDLAVEGFVALREQVRAAGPQALDDFYRAARLLVEPRLAAWERRWSDGPLAAAEQTGRQLTDLREPRDNAPTHLRSGGVYALPAPRERYGMCGRLSTYDPGAVSGPVRTPASR
jgi:mannose-6-phosphate isomerase-like protein (cupin superfamily)